jgi:putative hydrolase of the HAD superfamily
VVRRAKREARERALELLYEAEAKGLHPAEVIAGLPVAPVPYAAALAEGVGDHTDLLDHVVGGRARGWTVARMPAVDRALLRQATYELAFEPELPTAVAIDEAVELARSFSTDASPGFVNGVLSKVVEDVRGDGPWAGARRPRALVLDCDGVVRHFDPEPTRAREAELGLEPGAVHGIALEPALLRQVTTGEITAEAWAEEVGRRAAERFGVDAAAARDLWATTRWVVDEDVVGLTRQVAAAGVPVSCFSNATDRLEDDLERAGVADVFATIVNSSRIGEQKPDAAFYAAACKAAGVEPSEVLFVDDRRENVVGALDTGLHAVRFQGAARLRAVLVRCGLLAG